MLFFPVTCIGSHKDKLLFVNTGFKGIYVNKNGSTDFFSQNS